MQQSQQMAIEYLTYLVLNKRKLNNIQAQIMSPHVFLRFEVIKT